MALECGDSLHPSSGADPLLSESTAAGLGPSEGPELEGVETIA